MAMKGIDMAVTKAMRDPREKFVVLGVNPQTIEKTCPMKRLGKCFRKNSIE